MAGSVNDFAALASGPYIFGELEPESDGDVPDDFHPSGRLTAAGPKHAGIVLPLGASGGELLTPSSGRLWALLHRGCTASSVLTVLRGYAGCPADVDAEAEGGASRARRLAWQRTRRRKEEERLRAGETGC